MISFDLEAITKGLVVSSKRYQVSILANSEAINLQPVFTEDPVIDEKF